MQSFTLSIVNQLISYCKNRKNLQFTQTYLIGICDESQRSFQPGIIVKLFGCPIESAYALVYDADIVAPQFVGKKTMINKLFCTFRKSRVFV